MHWSIRHENGIHDPVFIFYSNTAILNLFLTATKCYFLSLKSQIEYTANYTSMYALYKKDKRPNQMKMNYISYNKIPFNAQLRPSEILNHTNS